MVHRFVPETLILLLTISRSLVGSNASFFKIKLNMCLDTLIQKLFFQIMNVHNFQGSLTDVSAKKEALVESEGFVLLILPWKRYPSA